MKELLATEMCAIGHPDKVCDQISDAILDAYLHLDPDARVDCTALLTHKNLFICGEITSKATIAIESIAKKTIHSIGYDPASFTTTLDITTQSEDIQNALLSKGNLGAGDQGIMVGYATDETAEYMPSATVIARKIVQNLADERLELGPDGKCLVGVSYENFTPQFVDFIIVSSQHQQDVDLERIKKAIPQEAISEKTRIFINPGGRFVLGGPFADTGLTGRKVVVDTYGIASPHGGGAFSGKDPTKVDRSATLMARYIAKNIVAAKLAKRSCVTLYYVIGDIYPLDLTISCFGTETIPIETIKKRVLETFDLSIEGILSHLDLRRPIYAKTAWLGPFGRNDPDFTWEKCDKAAVLSKSCF